MSEISIHKTMNMISTDDHQLFLFLCSTTIDWILILMVYVYQLKSLLLKQKYHNLA